MVDVGICSGNPGAITFVMAAYKIDPFKAEQAFQKMQDNKITGDKLYMLWNDCCDRDTEKAIKIMLKKPIEDIIAHINYERGRGIMYQ